jgi:hypothetical protein
MQQKKPSAEMKTKEEEKATGHLYNCFRQIACQLNVGALPLQLTPKFNHRAKSPSGWGLK